MSDNHANRRVFLQRSLAAGAAPYFMTAARAAAPTAPSDRLVVAGIGLGGQGRSILSQISGHATIAAIVDVDKGRFAGGVETVAKAGGANPDTYVDYRRVLDRGDIDAVLIATPDHWHTKIAVEAMQAGKDIFCEKPLTLTIEEGKILRRVAKDTGRVVQVGTMQRSWPQFLQAVALVREGRIGQLRRIWVAINSGKSGGPFPTSKPPTGLDWDRWLGQAPAVDYIRQRCHYDFRWWYEYSGGKLTDWGAHHVDIAQWGAGLTDTSPIWINPLQVTHPVPFKEGTALDRASYNTATKFIVECRFANGVELRIQDEVREPGIAEFPRGVLFEGTEGRLFVNRDRISGRAANEVVDNPLPEDALTRLYKGRKPTTHMANFVDCVRDRAEPVSDVASHHRILTTCHLSNIAMRLGRPLVWNPETEAIADDPHAQSMVSREQRPGYEIVG